jgi:hypothetical protein
MICAKFPVIYTPPHILMESSWTPHKILLKSIEFRWSLPCHSQYPVLGQVFCSVFLTKLMPCLQNSLWTPDGVHKEFTRSLSGFCRLYLYLQVSKAVSSLQLKQTTTSSQNTIVLKQNSFMPHRCPSSNLIIVVLHLNSLFFVYG